MVRVREGAKPSQTQFQLIKNYKDACWVEAKPKTGRTHQIRVHSAHIGHPIVGDEKYGADVVVLGDDRAKQRLYLHARAIQFNLGGKNHMFQAELDDRFGNTLKQLGICDHE